MKKHLLLLLLPAMLFISCGKSKDEPTSVDVEPGFEIHIKKNIKLQTGQLVANTANTYLIHIWKTDGIDDEDLGTTYDHGLQGYMTDLHQHKLLKAEYTFEKTSDLSQKVLPGKYKVMVFLGEQPDGGSFAWTATSFMVKENRMTILTKIFTSTVHDLFGENWDTKE